MRTSLSRAGRRGRPSPRLRRAQVNVARGANAWSYAGPTAPEHWTGLGYPACSGALQSPVDLVGRRDPSRRSGFLSRTRRGPRPSPTTTATPSSSTRGRRARCAWARARYDVVQLHVHVPSEHTVRGHRFAGEAHLVHGAAGARAVLGTLIVEGAENPAWDALIRALPGKAGERVAIGGEVDLVALLGLHDVGAEWIYSYAGSLTTPPCDQDVRWLVRAAPITLSRAQVEALSSAMVRNARPLQARSPLHPDAVTLHRGQ
jgi:carbonic anhydrase